MRMVDFQFEYDYLIEKTDKAIIQILYEKGLFDMYQIADEALKDYIIYITKDEKLEK